MNKETNLNVKSIVLLLLAFLAVVFLAASSSSPVRMPNLIGDCGALSLTRDSRYCFPVDSDLVSGYLINFFFWLGTFGGISVIYYSGLIRSKKRIAIITAILSILLVLFLLNQPFFGIGANKLLVRKSYSSLPSAINNRDYRKFPTISLFKPGKTDNLETDTSAGGGPKCCEQPTFYVLIDRRSKIFWIQDYQASLAGVHSQWYGPFYLEN